MKRLGLFAGAAALLLASCHGEVVFAGQVPNPVNAPASTTNGDVGETTANPQQAADSGLSLTSEGQGKVLAGPCSGSGAASFRTLCAADLPSGAGTVTSVALSLPPILTVGGSPIVTSGTLTATLAAESANRVFAGPSSGSAAAPTFRALTTADLPTITSLGIVSTGTWDAGVVGAGYGGTGAASPTAHGVLVAEGSSAANSVVCSTVGAAFIGQGSSADLKCQGPVTSDTSPASPTAPASTSSFAMLGLGGTATITPQATGVVQILFRADVVDTGAAATTAAGTGIRYQIRVGAGATTTGATCGSGVPEAVLPAAAAATGDVFIPTSSQCVTAGLTPGSPYWVDLTAEAVGTASAMTFANIQIVVVEVK